MNELLIPNKKALTQFEPSTNQHEISYLKAVLHGSGGVNIYLGPNKSGLLIAEQRQLEWVPPFGFTHAHIINNKVVYP